MLHKMRNYQFQGNSSERALVSQATKALEARLPAGWRAMPLPTIRDGKGGQWTPDALIEIRSPQGVTGTLVLEARSRVEPRDVAALVAQFRGYGKGTPTLIAPFLSLQTIERLRGADIAYMDLTGNARVVIARPGLFVETQGARQDPRREERPARSLRGAKAGRIVRALCDFLPPLGVRDLASRSGTNPGYVSRVLDLLEREDLIKRRPRKPITSVDWPALIRRWAQDYSVFDEKSKTPAPLGTREVQSYLEPRGLSAFLKKLQDAGSKVIDTPYSVTGSLAASKVAPIAPPRLAICYVETPSTVATHLGLQPADAGANVFLATPFDPVVYERTWLRDGVRFAALSQVTADLLTGPGRGPAEADALIEWMGNHERTWRS